MLFEAAPRRFHPPDKKQARRHVTDPAPLDTRTSAISQTPRVKEVSEIKHVQKALVAAENNIFHAKKDKV